MHFNHARACALHFAPRLQKSVCLSALDTFRGYYTLYLKNMRFTLIKHVLVFYALHLGSRGLCI